MKKMYFIFSLLLMILGINTAYAGVTWGGAITDPSTLKDGSRILIHENEATNGNYKFLSTIQDSAVYVSMMENSPERYAAFTMEIATGKTIKDEQAYYLKNEYNGKYLSYVFVPGPESEGGSHLDDGSLEMRIVYTDIDKATPIIIKQTKTAVAWFDYSIPEDQVGNVTDATVMIIGVCPEDENRLIALNDYFASPYLASYADKFAWWQVGLIADDGTYLTDLNTSYTKVKNIVLLGKGGCCQ